MRNKKKNRGGGGSGSTAAAVVVSGDKASTSGASNTSCYLQVVGLGTDTGDAVPGALLFFDRRRLLFNCGEGLQRYAIEHGLKLAKLSDVLLTRLTPDAAGGLPGLCLSTAEARGGGSRALSSCAVAGGGSGRGGANGGGNTPIRVFGPRGGLSSLVGALRTFVDTSVQAVEAVEFGDEEGATATAAATTKTTATASPPPPNLAPVIEDDDVRVVPIVVPLRAKGANRDDGAPAPKRARLDGDGDGRPPPSTSASASAVCYACELSSIPGRFKPEAALALGVPRGPLWGRLKAGQSVEVRRERSEDGGGGETSGDGADAVVVVRPEDVAEPPLPGPVALVVDAPSVEHAREMARSPAFARWSRGGSGSGKEGGEEEGDAFGRLAVVLHLTPDPTVVASEEYAAFCRRFDGGGRALAAAGRGERATATAHVFSNGAATRRATVLASSAALAARLNAVNGELFPLHRLGEEGGEELSGLVDARSLPSSPVVAGDDSLKFHLRPSSRLAEVDASSVAAPLDVSRIQRELRETQGPILEEAARAAEEAERETIESEEENRGGGGDGDGRTTTAPLPASRRGEARLVFLGTGAAAPSKYRNVTGTLLRLRRRGSGEGSDGGGHGGLLLDCGEGSLGQLTRAFGSRGCRLAVRSLELVWVSHIHADHHAGLPRLLMARAKELEEADEEEGGTGGERTPPPPKIPVLGPRPLRRVLAAYERVCGGPGSLRYEFFDNGDVAGACAASAAAGAGGATAAATDGRLPELVSSAMSRLGIGTLLPVRVFHCAHSFGLVVEQERGGGRGAEGKAASDGDRDGARPSSTPNPPPSTPDPPIKISFSGDTRRCPPLELAASGSHLLVHEATFEDGLEGEAAAKNHSTTRDALETAAGAGAAAALLTHFSQRYPKVPAVDVVGKDGEENGSSKERKSTPRVGVAFDLLQVDVVDAGRLLPALTGPLRKLFDALEGAVAGGGEDDDE